MCGKEWKYSNYTEQIFTKVIPSSLMVKFLSFVRCWTAHPIPYVSVQAAVASRRRYLWPPAEKKWGVAKGSLVYSRTYFRQISVMNITSQQLNLSYKYQSAFKSQLGLFRIFTPWVKSQLHICETYRGAKSIPSYGKCPEMEITLW